MTEEELDIQKEIEKYFTESTGFGRDKIANFMDIVNKALRQKGERIEELEQKLEQTEKDLADYQFNYPTIKELEQEKRLLGERCNQLLKDKGDLTDKLDSLTQYNGELCDSVEKQSFEICTLENKIADIKANCDLAIEGRDVKIMELKESNKELKKLVQQREQRGLEVQEDLLKEKEELEQQIEKAVEIIRELGGTVREGVTCHYLVDNGALHQATLFLKEIEK